ncbi:hypothetical protein [Streptomyces sp. NPDC048272]|uniref:hypothetical protein n=1 Tax=Streptomyces sp. NPDC048272 TaxID=3154616 RepID=UPI003434F5A0
MAAAGIGADFLVQFIDDPEAAVDTLRAAVSTGEFTAGQLLDEAVDNAALAGLLALREAQGQRDPSSAAETCLLATRQFAMAFTLASADFWLPAGYRLPGPGRRRDLPEPLRGRLTAARPESAAAPVEENRPVTSARAGTRTCASGLAAAGRAGALARARTRAWGISDAQLSQTSSTIQTCPTLGS